MGRSKTAYTLYSTAAGELCHLGQRMDSWMAIYVETDPDIARYERGGPSWTYLVKEKPKVASVHMSVWAQDGALTYWHACGNRSNRMPVAYDVVQQRAHLAGVGALLFDPAYLDARPIETRNRAHIRALLRCARDYVSLDAEVYVLDALAKGRRRLGELAGNGPFTESQVTVAVLRMWLGRRIDIPIADQLVGSSLVVSRRSHAQ